MAATRICLFLFRLLTVRTGRAVIRLQADGARWNPLGMLTPGAVAQACQDVIWSELSKRGVRRDDRSTWTTPLVRISCPDGGPFVQAGTAQPVQEACDQLLGPGRWWQREGVGGSVPVRFPSEQDPADTGWHLDGGYETNGQRRVNIRSRGAALLALYLFSDVDERSAPTRLRPGSHTAAHPSGLVPQPSRTGNTAQPHLSDPYIAAAGGRC